MFSFERNQMKTTEGAVECASEGTGEDRGGLKDRMDLGDKLGAGLPKVLILKELLINTDSC